METIEIFKLFGSIGIKNKDANKAIDETTGKAKDSSGKIGAIFSKLAGVLGTLFAGKVLFDFGKSVVQAAANAKAIESQFVQVFGSIEKEARTKLDQVAKQAGALPNRIKPAFNQIASFAKVTGMGAKESLDFTARATTAAADSAAFYDKSLEETTETLKSYLKGNFEVADNLGILSTETTRNEAATKMFGKAYKDLEGQQQQQVLLKMYEDANKVSGAMGQAARESDGFENVMGNLKQAWEDFKASIGGAVLKPVVTGLQIAVSWIKSTKEWLGKLKNELKENGALQSFKEGFARFGDMLGAFGEMVSNIWTALSGGQEAKLTIEDVGGAIKTIADAFQTAMDVGANFFEWLNQSSPEADAFKSIIVGIGLAFAGWGLSTLFMSLPGMLTAAGTAFMAFSATATAAITSIPIIGWIAAVIAALIWFFSQTKTGREIWSNFMSWLGNAWENTKTTVWNILLALAKITIDTWNKIKTTISTAIDNIKNTLANTWNSIKSTVSSVWNSVASTISGAIDRAKNAVQSGINKMKSMFNFKWSLPHISLPHFSVSGGKAPWGFMGKGSLPSVSVDWYAKGGIMTAPTLFGMNGDRAMVGGEAGPEAVLPLNSKTLGQIGKGIHEATSSEDSVVVSLLSQMVDLLDELLDKDIDVLLDSDSVVAKTWKKTQEKIEFTNRRNKRLRGEV
ncbi:phage tail tape measure protein [Streptococcus agalactiae]